MIPGSALLIQEELPGCALLALPAALDGFCDALAAFGSEVAGFGSFGSLGFTGFFRGAGFARRGLG